MALTLLIQECPGPWLAVESRPVHVRMGQGGAGIPQPGQGLPRGVGGSGGAAARVPPVRDAPRLM